MLHGVGMLWCEIPPGEREGGGGGGGGGALRTMQAKYCIIFQSSLTGQKPQFPVTTYVFILKLRISTRLVYRPAIPDISGLTVAVIAANRIAINDQ
jgi:hypothetical protein